MSSIEAVLAGSAQWHIEHGDCLEVMRGMPDGCVDLVFTSPPYNLGVSTGGGMSRASAKTSRWQSAKLRSGYDEHDDAMPWPDYVAWQKDVLRECWRLLSDTGAIYYVHKPRVQAGKLYTAFDLNPDLPVRQVIIWDRGNGFQFNVSFYRPVQEWITIFAKPAFRLISQSLDGSGLGDIWHVSAEYNLPWHPAPFPVELAAMAVSSTKGGTVLDPFSGSGSTCIASLRYKRSFIGIDNAANYCEQARQRVIAEQARFIQPSFMELSA